MFAAAKRLRAWTDSSDHLINAVGDRIDEQGRVGDATAAVDERQREEGKRETGKAEKGKGDER